MRVEWGAGSGPATRPERQTASQALRASRDFIGQFELRGLQPDTEYWYRVVAEGAGSRGHSEVARLRTAPAPGQSAPVHFTWGGDVGQGMVNRPPFPAFGSIAREEPAFFIFNGDTIYGDSTTPVGPGATTVPEYWAKYKENREDPLFQALAMTTPMIVNWDDHEVDNNYRGDNPQLPPGRQAFTDYWPISARPPSTTYRSIRWGSELEVFVLNNRQFADPLDARTAPTRRCSALRSATGWPVACAAAVPAGRLW